MSGSRKKSRKSAAPIYSIAIAWLAVSAIMPLYSILRILAAAAASAAVFFCVRTFVKSKGAACEEAEEEKPAAKAEPEQTVSHGEAVDAIIKEGKTAQKELGRLYASIENLEVKRKIRDIMEVSDKIVQDAITDPSDVPQIKKFLDYYLPTTIKLLNAYDRMGSQGIQGDNITGTMNSIEEMLDTAIAAYRKLLDSLFANQAMDIETDIQVMNTLLKREGLAGQDAGFGK